MHVMGELRNGLAGGSRRREGRSIIVYKLCNCWITGERNEDGDTELYGVERRLQWALWRCGALRASCRVVEERAQKEMERARFLV